MPVTSTEPITPPYIRLHDVWPCRNADVELSRPIAEFDFTNAASVDTGRLRTCRCDRSFFLCSGHRVTCQMSDDPSALSLAKFEDLADALAFALRFEGRKRVHNADELMSAIVAKRLVEHLERSGFVVMKRPPIGGAAALGRGHGGR